MVTAAHSAPARAAAAKTAPSVRLVDTNGDGDGAAADARSQPHSHIESMSATTRRRLRPVLTTLHALLGAAALGGAGLLVADPSGALVGLSTAQLSAFTSYVIPGLILGLVGLVQLAVAWYTTRPGAAPMTASHWAGALTVLFVVFQTALVGPILVPSVLFAAAGALIYSLAHELHRDEPHTPLLP